MTACNDYYAHYPCGIAETVTDISNDHRITQERISDLIRDLGFNPDNTDFNVVMEDTVAPSTGEAMMSKRAEPQKRRLVFDALVTETLSHPPLAICSPKEDDTEQMSILSGDEYDEIERERESTASIWLHMASEVSKAYNTLLVSPVIISITGTDSTNQHFHTDFFDKEVAQEICDTIQDNL